MQSRKIRSRNEAITTRLPNMSQEQESHIFSILTNSQRAKKNLKRIGGAPYENDMPERLPPSVRQASMSQRKSPPSAT